MSSFVDTNVLVYAFDRSAKHKRTVALKLLESADLDFVISSQVLSEFYVATTRKLDPSLTHDEAVHAVGLLRTLPVVALDESLVAASMETASIVAISLWDAQIIEAAARAGCSELLTEDLNDGQIISGVVVKNPFSV